MEVPHGFPLAAVCGVEDLRVVLDVRWFVTWIAPARPGLGEGPAGQLDSGWETPDHI